MILIVNKSIKMLNKLNKSLTNKQLFALISQRIRYHNTNSSHITGSSKSDPSKSDSKSSIDNNAKNIDYLGIFDSNHKEMSGLYEKSDDQNDVIDKYKELVDSRQSKMNDQNYLTTTFGRVRLDSDNNPKYHGQYDPHNTQLKFNVNEFEDKLRNKSQIEAQNESQNPSNNENIFEEQYFDKLKDFQPKGTDISPDNRSESNAMSSHLGFIDRQYFAGNPNIEPLFKRKISFRYSQDFNEFLGEKSSELASIEKFSPRSAQNVYQEPVNNNIEENSRVKRHEFESPLKLELFSQNFDLDIDLNHKSIENFDDFEELIQKKIDEQMDIKLETVKPTADKYKKTPRTGSQYLEDLQSGKELPKYPKLFTQEVKDFRSAFGLKGEKLDSKGFRILSAQVFDYTKLTREDILRLLMDSVLFDDRDIIAINKPYGMSIHAKESNTSPVLTEYLPQMCSHFGIQKLYTVHRLDKDTTGVLLLAKTQEKAKDLNKMFVEHSIIKRYLCISRGVPDQLEGIIDIPIEVGKCGDRERMVLRPEALEEYKKISKPSKTAKRAVTQYKVVSQHQNTALIEVWPKTGVRHQIRVHLGFGLRCPILGDHKYSHLDKIAPQKLTNDMLFALNVRQAKVRHIPLHLHAMQYCLPGAGVEGRNIFINAPLPHHFHKNMSKLGVRQ